MFKFGDYMISSGDKISCLIRNQVVCGILHFVEEYGSVRAWICHNVSEFAGDRSPKRYGYNYSWGFHPTQEGRFSDEVSNIIPIPDVFLAKEKIDISADITYFLTSRNLKNLLVLFQYKLGIFDEFTTYDMSENEGFINLKSDRKTIEVRFSRFIKQLATKYEELIKNISWSKPIDINDKMIEDLYNNYVSYQKSGKIEICFLKGEDILKGYTKSNYPKDITGTLHKSCMVDQLHFLKIYTDNPNQVELAVIYLDDKIVSRTIVWTANDGNRYSDRVYYTVDWMEGFMRGKLQKMGIEPIVEQSIKTVQLENWMFEQYPYMDHFYHFDKKHGVLFTIGSNISSLRNTDGRVTN